MRIRHRDEILVVGAGAGSRKIETARKPTGFPDVSRTGRSLSITGWGGGGVIS